MSTYDSTGISMDIYDTSLAAMVALAEDWKGESISTDEKELLGHILRQVAYQASTTNEKVQQIYDAMGVVNNTGVSLDTELEFIDMERQSAAASTATVTCTVSKATIIPAGSTISTEANVYFLTDSALIFTGAGSDDVTVTCSEVGPNNAGIGDINTIVSSVDGWTSVTNAAVATPGRYRETDTEFKVRHALAVATSGERDSASILEAVGSVSGVSAVYVDEDYYPIETYVIGGDDDDVASAIDVNLTVGIQSAGSTTVSVYSAKTKKERDINFTRSANLDIYIDLEIQTTALFPADGDDTIKSSIETHFEGNNIADNVVFFEIPTAIYETAGAIIQSLYIGTSPSPTGTSDISITNLQRAIIDTANITITHV